VTMHTSELLCALLVVLVFACVFLVDLERHAAAVTVGTLIVGVVEQFRLLCGRLVGGAQVALDAVGALLLLCGCHVEMSGVEVGWNGSRPVLTKFWWSMR
jgi:hypothetical protein